MPRVALLALGLVVAVPLALGASSSRSDAPFPPIGNGQRVAVVVCKYKGSSDPVIPVTQWVNVLNAKVNDYYKTATQNQSSFSFEAVPGVCQFDFTYEQSAPPPGGNNSIVDDPAVVFREGGQAVLYADQKRPGLWASRARSRSR